jgi:hypothetical protein
MGAPKKEQTEVINFRVNSKRKSEVKFHYGKTLNKLFNAWFNGLKVS